MNAINGSSEQTIEGDGSGEALKEIKPGETLNQYYVKDAELKDKEYDEFKQYDDNVIEMKAEEKAVEPKAVADDKGQIRIVDMTKEQLQNAVVNLMNVQQQLETTLKEYQARAKRIQQIWSDKKSVKDRYFMLRDNPKAKGVRVE